MLGLVEWWLQNVVYLGIASSNRLHVANGFFKCGPLIPAAGLSGAPIGVASAAGAANSVPSIQAATVVLTGPASFGLEGVGFGAGGGGGGMGAMPGAGPAGGWPGMGQVRKGANGRVGMMRGARLG